MVRLTIKYPFFDGFICTKKITLINAQKLYLLILKWLSLFVQHGGHTRLFTLAVNLIHTQVFITLSKLLSLLPMVFASLQAQNYPLDGADNWDQTGFKLLNIVPLLWSWISWDQLYHLSDPTTTPYFLKNGTPATLSQNNPDVIVSCSCVSLCHVVNMCYCVSFPSNPIFQKRKFARDKCFIGGFCWIEVCCRISTLSYSSPIPTNHDRSHYGCGPMCTYHRLSAITHCTRNIEQHPSMLWPHSRE